MVAEGNTFGPGQTIQIGWLYGQFRPHLSAGLTIYEPDLDLFPVNWVPGVTNILRTKRAQVDVADSFGLRDQATFSSFRHSCLHCTAFSRECDFFMSRWEPKETDSGWFIGCLTGDHDHDDTANLRRVSTYELVTRVSLAPLIYLALPPEVIVTVQGGLPSAGLPDRELPIQPGSFLHAVYERSRGAV
jgi:hypothetical protein